MFWLLNLILLPVFFFISFVIIWEDIAYGKIRNRWIIFGLIWSCGIFFLFFIWFFIAEPVTRFILFKILNKPIDTAVVVFRLNLSFILETFWNFFISIIFGFLSWRFKIWAPGDAKLFILYSFLIPLYFYRGSYFYFFPSFVLLINIFCIFLSYLFLSAVFFFSKLILLKMKNERSLFCSPLILIKKISIGFKSNFLLFIWQQIKSMLKNLFLPFTILLFFYFFGPLILSKYNFNIYSWQPLLFASLVVFSQKISKFLKNHFITLLFSAGVFFICLHGFLLDAQAIIKTLYKTTKALIVFFVIINIFQKSIEFYVKKNQSLENSSGDSRERLVIKPSNIVNENKLLGENHNYNSSGINLGEERVEFLKEKLLGESKVAVRTNQDCHFALWMFVGALATLILKKSLINILFEYIKI